MQVYRYDFQNNISYKLTPSTTISMNMNAQIGQNVTPNVGSDSFFNYVLETNPILMTPVYPARDGYDHMLYGTYARGGNQFVTNPYAQLQTSYWQYNFNLVNTVVKVDQDLDMITKGLKFNMWVNFKGFASSTFTRGITPYLYTPLTRDVEDWQNPIFDLNLAGGEGSKYISQSGINRYADNTFELQGNLNWNRNFNGHEVSALVLYRMREFRGNVLPNRNQGFSGRATYDYMHRYLAEFNFGYNGTERLAKGYRFGFFPAASLGWVVSNEDFWEPLSTTVSHLKLRGSYGLVGSDDLTPPGSPYYFFYYDQITDNNLSLLSWSTGAGGTLGWSGSGGGPQMSYYALPTLGWEKVKKLDIGVDLRLFNDLNITFDYFHDRRYDILLRRSSWPASLGYAHAIPYGPVGKVDNKGVEGSITYTKAITPDLSVSFNGNFTYNRNKLVYSDELNYKYPWLFSTGLPVNHTRGYIAEGLFRSQEEIDNSPVQNLGSNVKVGDIKYRDLNGDGQINSDDVTMISPYGDRPRLQYGFGGTVNYKKFDFGFFFTGSAKVKKLINGMDPFRRSVGQEPRNMLQYVFENYFDPEKQNFDAEYPLPGVNLGEIQNNTHNSTFWLRDASFLRLRNLEAGYTFPFGRLYVQGNNLLNFTKFKYWDPEMAYWNKYPTQHSVTVGIQFNL